MKKLLIIAFLFSLALTTCKYDDPLPDRGGYPSEIGAIMKDRCSTAGCHNSISKEGAGGFDFSTWSHMFEGGHNGSSVIPFRADQSFLTYFINTYQDLGLQLLPTMPNNGTHLTHDEVVTIKSWIQNGAPDSKGYVWLSDNTQRKKYYVCNQGCDLVTVFDTKTRLPMRVIDVGATPLIESPHDIEVSPDGNYWYVIFLAGQVMQKYRTADDGFEGQVQIGPGGWSSMTITADGHYAFVVDWSATGFVALVDLQTMTKLKIYSALFHYPHGSCVSDDGKTLYITAQSGNCVYKVDITNKSLPDVQTISLEAGLPANENNGHLQAHQVAISPDGSKYYVTCQYSNDVRVVNVANDSLLAVIPVGGNPQELVFSHTHPYLFVSCMNDSLTYPGKMGSIAIINYQSNTLIKSVFSGYQPHGFDVDDASAKVYIANRNVTTSGPAPHHTSTCGGRNGYITIIDMHTLDLLPDYKVEVSVDPYEVGVRK